MSLDNILLGLLREPQSGYSLKQIFDTVFSHFWAAEISQIYRQLKALEKRGLLASRTEPSAKGPPRRLYETTPAGHAQLMEWLQAGPTFGDHRLPYLAQTLFLDELASTAERLAFFERLQGELRVKLQVLLDIDAETRAEQAEAHAATEDTGSDLLGQIILNHGIHRNRALLQWSEESLALLRSGTRDPNQLHQISAAAAHELRALDARPSPTPDEGDPS